MCDPLLISRSPLNCKHSLMSGLEAQQMSNWSDNYRHGALVSTAAHIDAALRWGSFLLSDLWLVIKVE